ncbi:hypothetical protein J5N97_025758 [Dioscorea zingiberensis]|uniref:Uncharacterized protein n=1 Tax=Dioscorea zingiberensis TaxID=325984 RepID=A0A9D5H634_9LILI|nr:hypothetical protein J5N97_025758 [Dioscorea zingiberensis]
MSTGSNPKRGKSVKGGDGSEKVVVAVKASKEISRAALVWALTHVVQPGDCITLLVVVPNHGSGRKILGFPIFAGDCASGHKRLQYGTTLDQKSDITDYCSQMMVQLHSVYDPTKVNIKIKIVSGSPCGAVAAESKRAQANWVVLDKQLKQEEKRCMEELQCNIVVMKRSQAKVLRLNLIRSPESEPQTTCTLPPELNKPSGKTSRHTVDPSVSIRGPTATPNSSPESGTPFTATEAGTSSVSSSDPGTSPFFVPPTKDVLKKEEAKALKDDRNLVVTSSDSDSGSVSPSTTSEFQPWVTDILNSGCSSSKAEEISRLDKAHISTSKTLLDNFSKHDKEARISSLSYRSDIDSSGNVREAVSLSRNAPLGPPPLCSICQHKAPVFGKPPRWFSYAELELATGGFSQANFLAEGGFGSVHRESCLMGRWLLSNNID